MVVMVALHLVLVLVAHCHLDLGPIETPLVNLCPPTFSIIVPQAVYTLWTEIQNFRLQYYLQNT